MIQVGDKILVRSGTGLAKAVVTEIGERSLMWEMDYPPGRSKLVGGVALDQLGLMWTEGWTRDSYNVLRFVMATER